MVIQYFLAMSLCLTKSPNECVVKEFGPYNSPTACMIDGEVNASKYVEMHEQGYVLTSWKCSDGKDT